ECDLDLAGKPPPSRPAPPGTAVVGSHQLAESNLGSPMLWGRHGLLHELAVDDLVEALLFRDREQVFDSGEGRPLYRERHGASIGPRAAGRQRGGPAASAPWAPPGGRP